MRVKILLFTSMLLLASMIQAQTGLDVCKAVGWASQNGGTTGGGTAAAVTVSTYADFKSKLEDNTTKVVYVSGTINIPAGGRVNMKDISGKTIIGLPNARMISTDMTSTGSGILYVSKCTNLIFRNLIFEGPGAYDTDGYDNICFDNCQNVWVDHCEFHDGMDGNLDIKNASNYISVTWCTFSYEKPPKAGGSGGAPDHRYTSLFGSSDGATQDDGKLCITMQFCWWGEGCRERMPRVRFGKIHMINNMFTSSVSNHCIRAGYKANILAEGNYFLNQKLPIDLYNGDYTAVKGINNYGAADVTKGTIYTPPYTLTVVAPADIVTPIKSCAGAKLPSPTQCSACGGTPNNPPTVSITAPANAAVINGPANVTITATAADSDGSIAKVAFYNGTTLLGSATASPYSYTWSSVAVGSYSITAVATDNKGASTTSTAVAFSVVNNNIPSLSSPSNATQSVVVGTAIAAISYTYGGTATSYTITGLPAGLTATVNTTTKTVTISGTPTASGTFTITTVGGTPAVSKQGTITVKNEPTLVATNATQGVAPSTAIVPMVFTWGAAATDVSYTALPAGLVASKNATNKTLTISGTPTASGTFSVTSIGGSPAITLTASVSINKNVILANWYPFQETTISLPFVTYNVASVKPAFDASAYTATGNTNGALVLSKGDGAMILTLNSLAALKFRWAATGGRSLQIVYGPTGTENIWNSPTTYYTSGGREQDLTALIPALVSASPIIVKIINNRADGGSLNITDLYVEGSLPTVATIDQTIALAQGWNLISFNVRPTDSTIATVFKDILSNVIEIKNMQGFWRNGVDAAFNSLTSITPGAGYLVNMASASAVVVSGTAITPNVVALNSGVNLVGVPVQTAATISTKTAGTAIDWIKNMDAYWQSTNNLGTLQTLEPGKAYFIHSTANATVNY